MNAQELAKNNLIYKARVGSHLFGTNTPESDEDFYGVFMPWDEIIFGFDRCEDVKFDVVSKDISGRNTAEAVDETLTEFRKYIKLCLENNPNIINSLFANDENVLFLNTWGAELRKKSEEFIHKGCYDRFVSYAVSQRHKMQIKPENYKSLTEGLDVLQSSPNKATLYSFCNTKPFEYPGSGVSIKLGDLNFSTNTYVSKAIKQIQDRISKATNRVEIYTKYGFDVKYGSNLIQLLMEGIEILKTGRVEFPLKYRSDILDIKNGKYTAQELITWSDDLLTESRSALENSKLPDKPNRQGIEKWSISLLKNWIYGSKINDI